VSVLYWLLNWPPRRGAVLVFLVLTAFSLGTLVAFDGVIDDGTGGNVTVEEADVTVRVNDEIDFPEDGNGSVRTCMGMGTPGDSVFVTGEVTFRVPHELGPDAPGEDPLVLEVRLANTGNTITERVTRTGTVTIRVMKLFEDDETLSPGQTADLRIRVRKGGSIVANASQAVTVEEGTRSYDC
jgi:hypothetical protein